MQMEGSSLPSAIRHRERNSWFSGDIPRRPLPQRVSVKVRPCCRQMDIITSRLESDLAQNARERSVSSSLISPAPLTHFLRCTSAALPHQTAASLEKTRPTCCENAYKPIIFSYCVERQINFRLCDLRGEEEGTHATCVFCKGIWRSLLTRMVCLPLGRH